MSAPLSPSSSSQKEKQSWSADAGRRRSMRVLLSVPILVTGEAVSGENFSEEARTLVVNAHGALISLVTPVAAGQQLTVANKSTQETCDCRVVYLGTAQNGKTQMGIEFTKPTASFWQIGFPPEDWIVPES